MILNRYHLTEDTRNVVDEFKGVEVDAIREVLQGRRRPFATLILNIDYDLNISTIVRNHNAFCGQEIFYIGRRKYNRRGCVGTYLYENITYFPTFEEAKDAIPSHYAWVGVDNRPGAVPMSSFEWPENPLLVFGHEKDGLDFVPELPYHCSSVVMIPQTGSVRSLNVSVAAGITMYDLSLKKGWL
jgi:tRNA G18 (ribose-2'-O)-methylase SpoU